MRLMLAITNRCSKTCTHCCFSSSPKDKRELSTGEMHQYIDEMASMSGGDVGKRDFEVRFTGGEPFLCFESLLETVGYAKKRGAQRIGCTSNAYWATSFPEARRKISELKSAGLNDLRLSCDEFHESSHQIESLRNAFMTAVAANISTGLKIVVYRGSLRASHILRLMGDVTRDIMFHIEELSLLPVGRARELPETMFLKAEGFPTNTWCDLLRTVVVDVEQDVYPCCSPFKPTLLHLGNTRRESLPNLIDNAIKNPLFKALADKGPIFFIPFLEKAGLDFPPGNYVNRCHLCQEVLTAADSSDAARDCMKEAIKTWESEQTRINSVLEMVDKFLTSA